MYVTHDQRVGNTADLGLNLLVEERRMREEARRTDAMRRREFRTYWGRRLREILSGRP